ncbi:heme exporter protein A [Breoghania corrubedonensis]|uniref:Heme exporter protein A n=1 Tax=Breoghania corrubedonensis TaxID=665038 RepID=A0A2T5VIA9_9HYPH|nr:heme ABC exporter ATP-binding protein CcmA [Breoghania corrubedonensis]PTW63499.1 heme exporter protein A [Breoghania corrubedonensis]
MKLIAEDLACERGGRRVFDHLIFDVSAGEALIVTGPNGVGKSSLLRVLAGLVPATSGTLTLEGGEVELSLASQCHYFGHADALKPPLTVAENLAFWRSYNGKPAASVDDALEEVGLEFITHLPAGYLSAGQRRRLALARLLVSWRPVWLLDEPTSALDAASEAKLLELMHAHLAKGGLIVAATHQDLPVSPARHLRFEAAEAAA